LQLARGSQTGFDGGVWFQGAATGGDLVDSVAGARGEECRFQARVWMLRIAPIWRIDAACGTLAVTSWRLLRSGSMQSELYFRRRWGGSREGSGRKKKGEGTEHCEREKLSAHDPVLVTWKLVMGLGWLRREEEGSVIREGLRAGRKEGCRIVQFSIQGDHLHLLVEASDREALVRGTRGLGCRLARGLNKLWGRTGKVFARRFHERVLKTLGQVRNALRYVLNNHHKHNQVAQADRPDPFSSGAYFDGWSDYERVRDPAEVDSYVWPPGWKLGVGWRRHYGAFALAFVPG
jgi:REP element-mobilizing transposase RayT